MICGLEPVKVSPALAHSYGIQEPLKVQLPTKRLIESNFSSRLQEVIIKEQHRLVMPKRISQETCRTSSENFTSESFEPCQDRGDSPDRKRTKARSRTNISDLSTSCSCPDLALPNQSDDEEDVELPMAAQTTIVIKNLSQFCTRDQILELLDANGLQGAYDLVYVPVDFGSMRSHCYAFVNFRSEELATKFQACAESSHGFEHSTCVGEGGCETSCASGMQGLQAAVEKYRNSPVMHMLVPDECKPVLFENGKMVAFPRPTKKIQKPRGLRH